MACLDKIFKNIEENPNNEFVIDLPAQMVTILSTGEQESFTINTYKKHNMTHGYDDIDYLQAMKEDIKAFATTQMA